jgi:hypothetical protein
MTGFQQSGNNICHFRLSFLEDPSKAFYIVAYFHI